jgi:hypothetical protein
MKQTKPRTPGTKPEAVVRLPATLSGVAGEYFVAAELSRRGYVATLTLRSTRGIDILASNADSTCSVGIQVKTSQFPKPAWLASKKVEDAELAENLFFVFVSLNGLGAPSYYVVPRSVVATFVRKNHEAWLSQPKRDGKPRKDTAMREFQDLEGLYLNRWDLLGLD